ncbi:phage tail termination protein [Streptomyces tsukubensis]|uniref:phage tail termination protein n=1 Tax=Streptomyces tsukubensis TaxID=83656 RepID=UPI003F4ECB2A
MTQILPDIEALAIKALRIGAPSARISVDYPADWDTVTPLIVVHRVGGSAIDPRFADRALMDVQCYHTTRREASRLARHARTILFDACTKKTYDAEGSLSGFTEVTGPWSPGPSDDARVSRFIATYQLTARVALNTEG